jgi:aminoglycoside 6'-N-acetyltransferase
VLLDEEPIGFVQWYRVADNETWRTAIEGTGVGDDAAGMDYLLGDHSLLGRGLGPRMLREFLDEMLPRYPEISSVVLSVGQENRRSWRALEKLGFARIWEGVIVSDDPSDEGPSYLYELVVR